MNRIYCGVGARRVLFAAIVSPSPYDAHVGMLGNRMGIGICPVAQERQNVHQYSRRVRTFFQRCSENAKSERHGEWRKP